MLLPACGVVDDTQDSESEYSLLSGRTGNYYGENGLGSSLPQESQTDEICEFDGFSNYYLGSRAGHNLLDENAIPHYDPDSQFFFKKLDEQELKYFSRKYFSNCVTVKKDTHAKTLQWLKTEDTKIIGFEDNRGNDADYNDLVFIATTKELVLEWVPRNYQA